MYRKVEERKNWRNKLKPQHAEPIVLDIKCDLCDHWHLAPWGAGSMDEHVVGPRDKKNGKEIPMGITLKIDQMTYLFLGWCQSIQCFNLVIIRCSSPSMTR
jgi:hypothetical protein